MVGGAIFVLLWFYPPLEVKLVLNSVLSTDNTKKKMSGAATPLAQTILVTMADVGLAMGVAVLCEELFPAAGDDRDTIKMLGEALGQTALNVLIVIETRNRLPQLYSGDPTGGAIVMPLALYLQPKLLDKYRVLGSRFALMVNSAIDTAKAET